MPLLYTGVVLGFQGSTAGPFASAPLREIQQERASFVLQ